MNTKMIAKFKVGDRVRATEDTYIFGVKIKKGMTGTVIYSTRSSVDVEFDDYINGHNCLGKGQLGHCWSCTLDMIEKIVKELKEPKEEKLEDIVLKKGDIVTLSNGTVIVVPKDYVNLRSLHIKKIERAARYKTIYEAPKDILDKKEKEYLSAVIKPFRKKVIYVKKVYLSDEGEEYISVRIDIGKNGDSIVFPNFKKGTMYKGMETHKYYTLEELGL